MYLYLFWLFPALIFLLFFMSDRRRLFNAYLFSINLGLLLLISAFLLVVRTELWFNQQIAMIVFVDFHPRFSQRYFLLSFSSL